MISASHRFGIDIHNANDTEKDGVIQDKTAGKNLWNALATNAGKVKDGKPDTDAQISQTEFIHVVTEKWKFDVEILIL